MAFTDTLHNGFTTEVPTFLHSTDRVWAAAAINDPCFIQKIARYVAEYVCSTLFILIINLSAVNIPPPWPAVTVGATAAFLIYSYGYISSALFNPSLTLAFVIRNRVEWPRSDVCQIVMYLVAQYIGGITGGCIAWFLCPKSVFIYPTALASIDSGDSLAFMLSRAFFAEVVFTFILTTVLLHEGDKRQSGNQHFGMAVGMCVTVSILSIGDISGCCLNSAVWLGTIFPALLVTCIHPEKHEPLDLSDAWIYWTAPFIGAAVSAFLFNNVFEARRLSKKFHEHVALQIEDNKVVGVYNTQRIDADN